MSKTLYSVDSGVVDVMRQGKDTSNEYPWLKKSTIHLYRLRRSMPGVCARARARARARAFLSSLSSRLFIFGESVVGRRGTLGQLIICGAF